MSGWKKKLREQVYEQMLAKQISVPEARARLESLKTGVYKAAGSSQRAALKSAAPAGWSEWYDASTNPVIRERAREAAQQELATKSMQPGQELRPAPGEMRAIVWAPGQDGEFGWQL